MWSIHQLLNIGLSISISVSFIPIGYICLLYEKSCSPYAGIVLFILGISVAIVLVGYSTLYLIYKLIKTCIGRKRQRPLRRLRSVSV
jgi:hypothetical protein